MQHLTRFPSDLGEWHNHYTHRTPLKHRSKDINKLSTTRFKLVPELSPLLGKVRAEYDTNLGHLQSTDLSDPLTFEHAIG